MANQLFQLQSWLMQQLAYVTSYDHEFHQTRDGILKASSEVVLKPEDLTQLAPIQAEYLGFRKWSEEDPTLYLIPCWLWSWLPAGLEVVSFGGEEKTIQKPEDIDNDMRFGCLAWGIRLNFSENVCKTYCHKNGNKYKVLMYANMESTNPNYLPYVIYQGENGKVWCKTTKDFNEKMTKYEESSSN